MGNALAGDMLAGGKVVLMRDRIRWDSFVRVGNSVEDGIHVKLEILLLNEKSITNQLASTEVASAVLFFMKKFHISG